MTVRISFIDKWWKPEVFWLKIWKKAKIRGLTQEQLAEKADVSSHYVAMVETCKTFPKPEMLERFAKTLGIDPHQLFAVENDPNERLFKKIVNEMNQIALDIKQSVKETIKEECKNNKKK